jgi:hypothetical protein
LTAARAGVRWVKLPLAVGAGGGWKKAQKGSRKRRKGMATHLFYPPVELPAQVQSYAQGLKDHHAEYGDVPGNSPAELRSIVDAAARLEPLADEIHDLELTLAAKLEAYHRAAAPLWKAFSEKVGLASVHAQKQDKRALASFLKAYKHHQQRSRAKAQADAAAGDDPGKTP